MAGRSLILAKLVSGVENFACCEAVILSNGPPGENHDGEVFRMMTRELIPADSSIAAASANICFLDLVLGRALRLGVVEDLVGIAEDLVGTADDSVLDLDGASIAIVLFSLGGGVHGSSFTVSLVLRFRS